MIAGLLIQVEDPSLGRSCISHGALCSSVSFTVVGQTGRPAFRSPSPCFG